MVKSKGGKRGYLCPHCNSTRITTAKVYWQSSYFCESCYHYGPWSQRKNVSSAEYVEAALKDEEQRLRPKKLPIMARVKKIIEEWWYGTKGLYP